MPETKWVRVTDKDTGHKRSVLESELPHGNYEVLEEDAVDHTGRVLPPEHNVKQLAAAHNDQTVAQLREEIRRRNEDRPDEAKIPAGGNKDDLIAALAADDANTEENS